MKQIATALVKAQMEMANPVKDAKNPFFKSTYADLNSVREAVLPILNKHGICVLQPQVHIEGKNYVKTMFIHESGETLEGLTEIIYNKPNDAQAQGSGITYARRYGLQSMACVGADDDDGNGASAKKDAETAIDTNRLKERINACTTLPELQKVWNGFTPAEKLSVEIEKETKKQQLSNGGK